ncbi:MAG TPA: hypothetical protein DD477_11870 [Spirochaetaceae bacterium]|nr:hypothetical protein [Spirochaetaceae bacterium]HAW86928.1 hypothetical protein [Spirochaetaceae bacterium]HAX38436.1 hypothetical protein [Spirochaetaceae bacterium]HBO41894.1 hypothetical protein [Spirochaetaceae bacterium]HCQ87833.1 hypothetical protein [Spirochaetaceae bacterium]
MLVRMLCNQLGARLSVTGSGGTSFTIEFARPAEADAAPLAGSGTSPAGCPAG